MADFSGQYLGRYYLAERLGEGGMATVYKGYDTRLERDIAVKIIRSAAFPEEELEAVLKRFEREAKSLAKLSHPNIVKVYDYGDHDGSPYLVMEYLPGGTLKKFIGKAIPWQDAVKLLLPIARGVAYAHQRGILHRDIKPANILITEGGEPMLSDFGIAKLFEGEQSTALTGSGMAIGTPEYMAPEQWTGITSQQSDLYSLGIVLYEMVAGRKPYVGDTPAAILIKQATEPLPSPRKFAVDLPESLEHVLIKALAKEPENRYKDLNAFISALENLHASVSVVVPSPEPKPVGETYQVSSQKSAEPIPAQIETRVSKDHVRAEDVAEPQKAEEPPLTKISSQVDKETIHTAEVAEPQKVVEPLPVKVKRVKTRSPIKFSRRGVGILIGGVVVILAVWLGSPLIGKLFVPAPVATKTITMTEVGSLSVSTASIAETLPALTSTSLPPSITASPKATGRPLPTPTLLPTACRQEPVRWSGNGHYYLGVCVPTGITWATANYQAKTRGGYLVTILSSAENKFVFKLIDNDVFWWIDDLGSNEGPWLGGIQSTCTPEPLCGWKWATGETWGYANWNEGEPNNMGSNENAAVFFLNNSKIRADKWNDVGGRQTMVGYVIEWDNDPSTPTPIPAANTLPTEISDDKGVSMRLVPAGEFIMGSDTGKEDEKPSHKVTLSAFYMDKYEVTNALYEACVDAHICSLPHFANSNTRSSYYGNDKFSNYPVIQLDWNQSRKYCAWRDSSLPTEAQWEKAARGIDGHTYPWGEGIDCNKANYNSCVGDTNQVGKYENGKSVYGIYDLTGNVWEWTADWYSATYYQNSPSSNPLGPDAGQYRVVRGGAWRNVESNLYASSRNSYDPGYKSDHIGFRCARSADVTASQPEITPTSISALAPTSSSPICDQNSAKMGFVADVTIPDDTQIASGQSFLKTWRIRNTGSCSWEQGSNLIYDGGEKMSGEPGPALGVVNPGQEVDVSMQFTAPTTPGKYFSRWIMADAKGVAFGNALYVQIVVK